MTQQQTERERLAGELERLAIGGDNETKLCMRKAAALLRGDEPAKPDRYVVATRAMLHAHQRAMTPPDSGWGDMSYEKGNYDHLPAFQAAAAVLRRHFAPPSEVVEAAHTFKREGDFDAAGIMARHILKGDV